MKGQPAENRQGHSVTDCCQPGCQEKRGHPIYNYIRVQGLWCKVYGKEITDNADNSNVFCRLVPEADRS